jgi:hypothetical protein
MFSRFIGGGPGHKATWKATECLRRQRPTLRRSPEISERSRSPEIEEARQEQAVLDDGALSDSASEHEEEEEDGEGDAHVTKADNTSVDDGQDGRGPAEEADPNWRIWDQEGYADM